MNSLPVIVRRLTIVFVLFVIIAAAIAAISHLTRTTSTIQLGSGVFQTAVMKTEAEREQGLSGYDALADNQAMLFVFPHDDTWGIWMKDMNFPIDIVWLDATKTVVHTKQNAAPDSYPEIYTPDKKARYVIELAAGTIKDKNIRSGMNAKFDITGEVK